MSAVGDKLTLAELISRSQSGGAFVTVRVVGGLITVIYGGPASDIQEFWQAVPDTGLLVLKRLITDGSIKRE